MGQPEEGWLPALEIFGHSGLIDTLLDQQGRTTPDLDLKARSAYLMIGYGNLLALVFVPMLIRLRIVPDLDPAKFYLSRSSDQVNSDHAEDSPVSAQAVGVRLGSSAFWTSESASAGHMDAVIVDDRASLCCIARQSVERHLLPLIQVLRAKSGLSSGALWRLAADSIAAVFLEAGRRLKAEAASLDMAEAVLKAPASPLRNRELHFFELTLRDPRDRQQVLSTRTFRARGGCCRFYTSSEGYLCSTCVLRDRESRDRILLEGMQKALHDASEIQNPSVPSQSGFPR